MLTIAEEFILLALDEETGDFKNFPFMTLEYGVAGAVLMDLQLRSRLDSDQKNLLLVDSEPTGIEELDMVLEMVRKDRIHEDIDYWVKEVGNRYDDIRPILMKRLVQKGVLKENESRFLWVFSQRKYPVIDNREEKEVLSRLRDLIMSDDIPEPQDIVLITLMTSCEILSVLFSPDELDIYQNRINQLAKMDLIGQSVYKAVEELLRWLRIRKVYGPY